MLNLFGKYKEFIHQKELEKKLEEQKNILLHSVKYITKIKVEGILGLSDELDEEEDNKNIYINLIKKIIDKKSYGVDDEDLKEIVEFEKNSLLHSKKLKQYEIDLIYFVCNIYPGILDGDKNKLLYLAKEADRFYSGKGLKTDIYAHFINESLIKEINELKKSGKIYPIKKEEGFTFLRSKLERSIDVFRDLNNLEIQELLRDVVIDDIIVVLGILDNDRRDIFFKNMSKRSVDYALLKMDEIYYELNGEKITFEKVYEALRNIEKVHNQKQEEIEDLFGDLDKKDLADLFGDLDDDE